MKTEREKLIVQLILRFLESQGGVLIPEAALHAYVNGHGLRATLAEMDSALALADGERWITGVTHPLHGKRWMIMDAGRATLAETR